VNVDHRLCALILDGDGAIAVIADGPVSLSEPWRSISTTSDRWGLPAWASIEALAPTARQVGSPCPALVVVGVTASGGEVYADPESLGALYVDADPTTADLVVNGIAAALASSVLAEAVHLIGVGVAPDCFLGSPNHQVVDSVEDAFEMTRELLGCHSTDESTFRLRARRTGGEEWQPVVVVVGSSNVHALRTEHLPGLAMIVAGAPPDHHTGLMLTSGTDSWRLEPFGVALTPLGLKPEELLDINELLECERQPSETEVSDVDSARPAITDPLVVSSNGRAGSTSGTEPVVVSSNGHAPSASISNVTTDALEWELMIRVFGLVDVVDADGLPAQFGKSKSLELLAWIGAHRDAATRLGARSALWDADVRDATFANIVSEARRATGRLRQASDGAEWLARTMNASLVMHERMITDADLMSARLDRARQQPSDEAIESLRSAVELIRGVPFAETGYLWPDAEGITSRLVVLATACCSELAELLLERKDIEGVFWATGQGLKVLPGHEELIAYRMRAHGREGDRAGVRHEWEAYERVLLGDPWSDGEPAPRLLQLRRELLSTPAVIKPSATT
ncbi:MAG: bacterial transcriptional activator domain-containing protein, partial [Actinomycetota bacterium]|nr:bacterial transcriptional activator domain-containing protein [Actinomycetota bacterium]